MIAADVHFYVLSGGLVGLIGLAFRLVYTAGKVMNRLDDHIERTGETFDKIDKRVTWLEQRRR